MQHMSNVFAVFAKKIPQLFSKESVNQLVMDNKIEFIHARESLAAIDANLSDEAHDENTSANTTFEKMKKLGFYANVKFEAMLEAAKEDERLLYDEFVNIDNARNQIMAKVVAKKENDVNFLLKSYKNLPGVNEGEVDELLKLAVRVEDIK